MGFVANVKKGTKSYIENYKKKSAEDRAYRNDVNQAVKKVRREAYKEEAIRQAQIRARIKAKQVYNPLQVKGAGKKKTKTLAEVMRDLPQ